MTEWAKFKSGTDIRGTACEGVEGQHVDLTDEVVTTMAKAFAAWLRDALGRETLTVSVGHDSRISAERLKKCVIEGLRESGISVVDCGLCSTPAMFMTTQVSETDCDGAIQLTASHHPFNKNGLKFFTKKGGLEGADISDILRRCEEGNFSARSGFSIRNVNFLDIYSRILVEQVEKACGRKKPLSGFRIVVDAGNGAGGFYVEKVLKPLGADTTGSQFLEPDGRFPNHIPNPENRDAMKAICSAVLENRADFGIIFDTDVDRAGAVGRDGAEINRNRLIALISAILLEERPGCTIVTDSVTSDGLAAFLAERGGVHHRFKRGYRNVINEGMRLNAEGIDCPLAIETSGHAALRENYFLDDGAYLVTRLLIKMAKLREEGKDLEDLVSGLRVPVEEAEIRMGFRTADFKTYGAKVLEELEKACRLADGFRVAEDNREGVRVNLGAGKGNGWFLLRMSLHDPIMPLNIESEEKGGTRVIARELFELLKGYEGLNLDNLKNYIEEK